ncbi:hypothetical protein K7432_008252 [Basidiobolus ranarum]|uniref:Uncharacterized protein n=1 Tax=Basidiobolus ranarum TaxID=34480 RepID=A0ABR2VYW3_9FUNG
MIQGAGGGLTASMKTANIGKIVVVIGLVIALASLLVFTWVTTTMMLDKKLRLRFAGPNAEYNESRWRIIYIPIYINIVMLVARSIYRLVEFLGGYDGYVSTHEEYFYGFDTLLIIIGYLSFIVIHPGRLKLFNNVVDEKAALTMNEM